MTLPVVILAGGLATRMRPLTATSPKVLLPVNGQPFADLQLRRLRSFGVSDVIYSIGHLGDAIRAHVGDGERYGIRVRYVADGGHPLGTAGALRRVISSGAVPESFGVIYGDSYLTLDLPRIEAAYRASGCPALMTVMRNQNQWDLSNAVYRGGRVVIYDKARPEASRGAMQWIDYGFTVLSVAAVTERVAPGAQADLADLLRALSAAGLLAGYEVADRFYEIGSPEGLAELERHLAKGAREAEGSFATIEPPLQGPHEQDVGMTETEAQTAAAVPADPGQLYDAQYYAHYDDHEGQESTAYVRGEPWLSLFSGFADRIVRDIEPKSVLDVGCALGLLVEALRDRGVDAHGFDVSEYAVSQAREDVRPNLWVGSVLEPIEGHYDLVTCLEVLEHIEAGDADRAVANLCAVTDDVVFSSTPDDWREETHCNVRPLEYWTELFARHDFVRDLGFDGSFIAWWAVRFRRRRNPWQRVVQDYEREVWRLQVEAHHRNRAVVEQMQDVNRLRATAKVAADAESRFTALEADLSEAQSQEVELTRRNGELEAELQRILISRSYRVARGLRRAVRLVAPAGSLRARLGASGARRAVGIVRRRPIPRATAPHPDGRTVEYQAWLTRRRPREAELLRMRDESRRWATRPLVSVILPVFNPEDAWVEDAVQSVLDQSYEQWELCLVDDCSSKPGVRDLLERFAARDARIRLTFREQNGGISAASNTALEVATGDYITLLDHDDVIEPHALHMLVARLQSEPELDFVYCDEDKISPDGERIDPFFKPEWSPELLLSLNYITHMALVRRTIIETIGRFRSETDGAQDFDLFLRCTEVTDRIAHVPEVLYSWRQVPGSAALSIDSKPWAYPAGRRAVRDALQRRGIAATVDDGPFTGSYSVHRSLTHQPSVAILIPTRDRSDLLARCLDSIDALSTYGNRSVTILDNDSRSGRTQRFFEQRGLRVVPAPGPFNFSRIVNIGVAAVEADYVLLLNNDVVVETPGWIEVLLEQAVDEGVAAVGALLLYPDGRPQHQGVTVDGGPGLGPFNLKVPIEFLDLPACWPVPREVSAVTGACMMVPTAVWRELGGFDEHLAVSYNDVDFCLRARARGYRVVYTPRARLVHEESATRGTLHPRAEQELFSERWLAGAGHKDPYTTPNVKWVDGRFRLV